jgi:hypothetical protein
LKEYAEAYTTKWGHPNASEDKDKKYAWKLIPTKDNEPSVKKMYTDENPRHIIGVHIIYNGQYKAQVHVKGNHQG